MKRNKICAIVLALAAIMAMTAGCNGNKDSQQAVTLSQSQGTLGVGEILELTASTENVIWISSDSTIASVDGGKVTGIQEGIATISAVTESGEAKCVVTVQNAYFPVLKIQNKASALFPNCEYAMYAKVSMGAETVDTAIVWQSSDKTVATINANGVVTGMKKGKTIISAAAEYQGIKLYDSLELVVSGMSYIEAPGQIEMGLYAGDTQWEVDYTVYIEEKATDEKAAITSQNPDIVSVDASGKLKAEKEGATNITLTYEKNGEYLEAVIPVTVGRHVLHTFTQASECYYTGDITKQNNSTIGDYWTTSKPVLMQGGQLEGEDGTRVYIWSYYWSPALSFSLDLTKEDLQRYEKLGYTKVVVPVYNIDPFTEGIQLQMGERVSAELPANGWKEVEFSLSELIANYNRYAIKGTPIIHLKNCWATEPKLAGGEVGFYVYFGDIYLR